MKSVSVILLCLLSFFAGCLFSASFMNIDSNEIRPGRVRGSKVMTVQSVLKNSISNSQKTLIIVVISSPSHYGRRQAIRQTWAKEVTLHNFSYIFCVGTSGLKDQLSHSLLQEQQENNDLVLLSHVQEHYNLLTQKILQTFLWLNSNSDHQYVLKCDDDSFVNVKELIKSPVYKSKDLLLYWGYFTGRAPVHRRGKWKESQWNLCDQYIPYARGGGYILSREVIRHLAANANIYSVYKNEDVSVGLWLAPLNISRHHDVNFDTEYKSRGCQNSYIVTHPHTEAAMRNMHKSLLENKKLCLKEEVVRQAYTYDWNVPPTQCCQNYI